MWHTAFDRILRLLLMARLHYRRIGSLSVDLPEHSKSRTGYWGLHVDADMVAFTGGNRMSHCAASL
jgi:hypothetical protein